MNRIVPTMLSSSKLPQPSFACWWPSTPSAASRPAYSASDLAVHDQVLPVHVDLDVVEALRAQLVDHVQRHPDRAHEDLHRGLGVLVLEEDRDAPVPRALRRLADALEEPRPRLPVGRLERVVVALDPRPDDEVGAELAGEVDRVERAGDGLAPGRLVGGRRARPCRSAGRGGGRSRRSRCRGRSSASRISSRFSADSSCG